MPTQVQESGGNRRGDRNASQRGARAKRVAHDAGNRRSDRDADPARGDQPAHRLGVVIRRRQASGERDGGRDLRGHGEPCEHGGRGQAGARVDERQRRQSEHRRADHELVAGVDRARERQPRQEQRTTGAREQEHGDDRSGERSAAMARHEAGHADLHETDRRIRQQHRRKQRPQAPRGALRETPPTRSHARGRGGTPERQGADQPDGCRVENSDRRERGAWRGDGGQRTGKQRTQHQRDALERHVQGEDRLLVGGGRAQRPPSLLHGDADRRPCDADRGEQSDAQRTREHGLSDQRGHNDGDHARGDRRDDETASVAGPIHSPAAERGGQPRDHQERRRRDARGLQGSARALDQERGNQRHRRRRHAPGDRRDDQQPVEPALLGIDRSAEPAPHRKVDRGCCVGQRSRRSGRCDVARPARQQLLHALEQPLATRGPLGRGLE